MKTDYDVLTLDNIRYNNPPCGRGKYCSIILVLPGGFTYSEKGDQKTLTQTIRVVIDYKTYQKHFEKTLYGKESIEEQALRNLNTSNKSYKYLFNRSTICFGGQRIYGKKLRLK